jgi:hypothetical protein
VLTRPKQPLWRCQCHALAYRWCFEVETKASLLYCRIDHWAEQVTGVIWRSPIPVALGVASDVLLFGVRLPQDWGIEIDRPHTRIIDRRVMDRRSEPYAMQPRISNNTHFVRVELYVIDRHQSQRIISEFLLYF